MVPNKKVPQRLVICKLLSVIPYYGLFAIMRSLGNNTNKLSYIVRGSVTKPEVK